MKAVIIEDEKNNVDELVYLQKNDAFFGRPPRSPLIVAERFISTDRIAKHLSAIKAAGHDRVRFIVENPDIKLFDDERAAVPARLSEQRENDKCSLGALSFDRYGDFIIALESTSCPEVHVSPFPLQ